MDSRSSLLGRLFGPLCCGSLLALLVLDSSVIFQTYAVDVEVKDKDNCTCLIAKWNMNITVLYESSNNEHKEACFTLPSDLTYDGSTCGSETYGPVLAMQFGEGNSWMITFDKTKDTYQGNITFIYNTDDDNLFPDAKRKGPRTISLSYPDQAVPLNTSYSCHCTVSIESDNVIQTFWDVELQAYVENNVLSDMVTQCHEDQTADETSTSTITIIVVVPETTAPIAGRASAIASIPPHPLPTVAPGEKPVTGNYSVKENGTICLLANMGLQLNISQIEGHLIMNINPNTTVVNGSCNNKTAVLQMNDDNTTMIDFIFAVANDVSEQFYLKEVNITVMDPFHRTQIHVDNDSLETWKAHLGNSYMCQRQQTLILSQTFSIDAFDVWVQPFLVKGNAFATADECLLDDDAIIIPIAVGAALAALIVLIVIAYIIGRRKSQVGYQTL